MALRTNFGLFLQAAMMNVNTFDYLFFAICPF